jgi:hypothetical protein
MVLRLAAPSFLACSKETMVLLRSNVSTGEPELEDELEPEGAVDASWVAEDPAIWAAAVFRDASAVFQPCSPEAIAGVMPIYIANHRRFSRYLCTIFHAFQAKNRG